MSNEAVKEQIETLKVATINASQSKEKAILFLKDAGIYVGKASKKTVRKPSKVNKSA